MKLKFKMQEYKFSTIFDNILDTKESFNILPLTHKVTWYEAINIMREDKIIPIECDVFEGENLIYLFYGIPSYNVAVNVKSRGDFSYSPVCFLLRTDNIEFVNCFPFDSGAFYLDMYSDYFNDRMNIYDFALRTDFSYISRFISTFYLSNDNYYRGICKEQSSLPKFDPFSDFHLSSYINLISKNGESKFDSRSHTIELISKKQIDLKNNLLAVFIPRDMKSNKYIIEYMKLGIDVITYNTFYNDSPSSYNAVIKEKMYEYLINKKII